MNIVGYKFKGPYSHTAGFKQTFGCVYVILNSNNNVVDVGQTSDVNERMQNHERKGCWSLNGAGDKSLYVFINSAKISA